MAAGLIFLVDKPLPAKGPQTGFDAIFINSKHKAYKKILDGEVPSNVNKDIILEIVDFPLPVGPIKAILEPTGKLIEIDLK